MNGFKFYNINPTGNKTGDCVVRAITLASGNLDYKEVEYKLWLIGKLYNCDGLSKFCYSHFIRDVLGGKEVNCDNLTVGEFAEIHPVGIYLIRVPNHLTCVIDGICYDIWNCLDEECDVVWKLD